MSRSKRRDEMLRLLRRKAREGLTYRELIAETGLCRSTLTAWAAKLRRELERDAKAEHAFVELVPAPDEAPAGVPIELVVDDRHVIRIRADFDEVALHRLLRALAACWASPPPCTSSRRPRRSTSGRRTMISTRT